MDGASSGSYPESISICNIFIGAVQLPANGIRSPTFHRQRSDCLEELIIEGHRQNRAQALRRGCGTKRPKLACLAGLYRKDE
jgi:hypothetical protein